MAQPTILKIITANDLLSGEVVYLTKGGDWSVDHRNADLMDDVAIAGERLALVESNDTSIVGAYLSDAFRDFRNQATPSHFREVFRTRGPSNRNIGKQVASS